MVRKYITVGLVVILLAMYTFPAKVEAEISKLNWLFAIQLRCFLLLVRVVLGYDVVIVDGARTPAEQDALHRQDSRNPAYNPQKPSSHILGLAVDLNFWKDGKAVLLKGSSRAAWQPVWNLAAVCGIKWGDFAGYPDFNHFYIS